LHRRDAQPAAADAPAVLGLARIADDVSPELACASIDSITVLGALEVSAGVRAALADRIH